MRLGRRLGTRLSREEDKCLPRQLRNVDIHLDTILALVLTFASYFLTPRREPGSIKRLLQTEDDFSFVPRILAVMHSL